MGKLQRYLWPKTALIFWHDKEKIDAAFGYLGKEGVEIAERRTIPIAERDELTSWYDEIVRTYPHTYVAAMLDTINQGALPECGKRAMERFGVDAALVHTLCVENRWLVYTSLVEMKWFEQKFKGITFDLLFSPFMILYHAARSRLEKEPALFVLHLGGVAFLAILSEDGLRYAQVLVVPETAGDAEDEEEGVEEVTFDLEMIEEDEVAPISDVDVLGEFQEEEDRLTGGEDEEALEKLEYTLNLFEELKDAIHRFYHDERYPNDFVEKVTIFDTDDLGSDMVRYIQDELFMQATLEPFDPIEAMAALTAQEVGG